MKHDTAIGPKGKGANQETATVPKAKGAPLDAEVLAALRRLIASKRTRELVAASGVSAPALERGAAGGHVLRGTAALIRIALERLGEVPAAGDQATS